MSLLAWAIAVFALLAVINVLVLSLFGLTGEDDE